MHNPTNYCKYISKGFGVTAIKKFLLPKPVIGDNWENATLRFVFLVRKMPSQPHVLSSQKSSIIQYIRTGVWVLTITGFLLPTTVRGDNYKSWHLELWFIYATCLLNLVYNPTNRLALVVSVVIIIYIIFSLFSLTHFNLYFYCLYLFNCVPWFWPFLSFFTLRDVTD